jgi:hypothetical protein
VHRSQARDPQECGWKHGGAVILNDGRIGIGQRVLLLTTSGLLMEAILGEIAKLRVHDHL